MRTHKGKEHQPEYGRENDPNERNEVGEIPLTGFPVRRAHNTSLGA
ncbi:hypothetical protein GCM10010407_11200 [Rarobacter incanus]